MTHDFAQGSQQDSSLGSTLSPVQHYAQDITQWIEEIQALKLSLAEAHQQRDDAYASAANWRKLYETEAQQRRRDAESAQQSIDKLQAYIHQLRANSTTAPETPAPERLKQELAGLTTPAQLRQKMLDLLTERDLLLQALAEEQASHAYTRQTLTTALGDTVDLLNLERASRSGNLPSDL
jgi:uncharacterized coiled-coil DUF342 family protein